jgi:hypothetical protein
MPKGNDPSLVRAKVQDISSTLTELLAFVNNKYMPVPLSELLKVKEISSKQSAFVINAGDYGAKGDLEYENVSYNQVRAISGTDTTASIQKALDVAGAMVPQDVNLDYEGAVRVVMPPGKYRVTKSLDIPSNVIFDCEHAVFFNFLSSDWEPVIKGRRHAHATIIKVHANKKSGVEWGDRNAGGVRCDSYIDAIWVEHAGVEYEASLDTSKQKCGLRLFGLWFRINRIEIKEANIGLDIFRASDVLCPSVFLMGCATACRLESAEQILFPSLALDTNIQLGIQIDNSNNVFMNVIAFVNSDGYGTPMDEILRVGAYSGSPCKDIHIFAAATSTGGRMLSIANCMDSSFKLFASNSRLFSQTSGNGQATSHWQAKDWYPNNSTQAIGGGLKAHDMGVNYQPYGNEGSASAAIKYGPNLSKVIDIELLATPDINPVEGTVYGTLEINGIKIPEPINTGIEWTNSWTAYDRNYLPGFYKNSSSEIVLSGLIKGGTQGRAAFVLPKGYRPPSNRIFTTTSGADPNALNALSTVSILTDGSVIPLGGSNSCFSLEGIRFRNL